MKRLLRLSLLVAVVAAAPSAFAQWQSVTYTLRGGWNAIFLHGDASHTTPDTLFAANPEIVSVWRWNPNPTPLQFGASPLVPAANTPEWSTWYRGQPGQSTLASLAGQNGYLIQCTGSAANTYAVTIPQRPLPPQLNWVRNGANLLGFPTRQNGIYPTFAAYFATFPAAVATGTRIYQYAGGDLGPGNPVQVFSPSVERLDRNQAYWFEAPVVGNFYAPLEIAPSLQSGLHFGRTGSLLTVRIRNRTSANVALTVSPQASAPPPAGQEAILAAVPLVRRTFDAATAAYVDTPLAGPITVQVAAQSSVELAFGVDRSLVTGAADALYASLLRFTDGGNLADITLPVSARVASMAGLWVGDISVSGVESKAPGHTGTAVVRPFPLRVLLHVDAAGTARLLSQVFIGRLAAPSNPAGLCTRESALLATDKANATRLTASHLPLDVVAGTGTGSVALGATLVRSVAIPFNDPTNPFVHTYHPDHDNRDARFQPVGAGVESPALARTFSFAFASSAPAGESSAGWGATVLGGTYAETVTGLHKAPLTVTGTFRLQRVSEVAAITLD